MDACVWGACDPSKTDENNRLFGLFNDRDDRLYLFLLCRCDHGIGVSRDGVREMHLQITVVGLNIHNKSLVLRKPLAESLGTDELRSGNVPGCVVSVKYKKSDESSDNEDRCAD